MPDPFSPFREKARKVDWEPLFQIACFCVVFVVLVVLVVWVVELDARRERLCQQCGYGDWMTMGNTHWCYSIRDGGIQGMPLRDCKAFLSE